MIDSDRIIKTLLELLAIPSPCGFTDEVVHYVGNVLDDIGIESATIVGLSAGAQAAIDFALAYPERVDRLVLVSPGMSGWVPVGSFDWMRPVFEKLQEGDVASAHQAWMETPLMRIETDARADSAMRTIVGDNARIWTFDAQLQRAPEHPAAQRLDEIALEALANGLRDFL